MDDTKVFTTDSVTSRDGTAISYCQLGSGPGIVLVHGAVSSFQHLMKLGDALSDTFTVYIPNRRGRGLSGPFGNNYGIQKEVEDLDALLKETDAHKVFGHSIGALISLHAALALPSIYKTALYEPPLDIDNSIVMLESFVPRLDQEIADGKVVEATVTFVKNFAKYFEQGPFLLSLLPRFLLVRIFTLLSQNQTNDSNAGEIPFRELLPTFHFDHELVVETQGTLQNFKAVSSDVLLLGGSKSPSFLKHPLDALSNVLPNVERVELRGLGHAAPVESDKHEYVAQELRRFFS